METQKETIEQRVRKVIAVQLGADPHDVKPESRLEEDLGADSLDKVEMVMFLEDEFDIDIPDKDDSKIKTVQQAIDYITSKVQP